MLLHDMQNLYFINSQDPYFRYLNSFHDPALLVAPATLAKIKHVFAAKKALILLSKTE